MTANSGINVGAGGMGPTFGGANLGTVTFTPGTVLTKTGANGVNLTIGTTSVPGGGAIGYNVADGGLNTATYSSGGAAITVNKTGGGQLNLTQVGTNLTGGSFNVQAGTLAATNDAVGTTLGKYSRHAFRRPPAAKHRRTRRRFYGRTYGRLPRRCIQ